MLCEIDDSVVVGNNVQIQPFCVIRGNTVLQDGAVIESFSYIVNSQIGQNTVIRSSRITDSIVGANCTVGPNAHLREGSCICDNCRVGNFVEIKKSTLGEGSKASHLAYIGDAEIGKKCNIGCGVVFVNYDGQKKHKTKMGDECFIGCNSNLIAPLNIGDRCFVASSSTVNKDMPNGAFAIGRSPVNIKENYADKYLKK